jgi:hypothetical protein
MEREKGGTEEGRRERWEEREVGNRGKEGREREEKEGGEKDTNMLFSLLNLDHFANASGSLPIFFL